jgi:hypothetical protein
MAIQNPVTTTPVTAEEMLAAAQRLKFAVPPTHERDYMELLKKTDACCGLIMAEDGELRVGSSCAAWSTRNCSLPARRSWSEGKGSGPGEAWGREM